LLEDPFSLKQEIELAVALGWDRPVTVLGFPFERLGLAYRYSDEVSGIRLIAGHPF